MTERIKDSASEQLDAKQLEASREAHNERLAAERERNNTERSVEKSVEETTKEVLSIAKKHEKEIKSSDEKSPAEKRKNTLFVTRSAKKAAFKKEMTHIQAQLGTPSRVFSKLIHNPVVEKTSEALAATIARPNALLAGSVVAFLFTLGSYLWARHMGFALSGFETIAFFILGWVVGILFDYLRIMITGRPGS